MLQQQELSLAAGMSVTHLSSLSEGLPPKTMQQVIVQPLKFKFNIVSHTCNDL